MVVEYNYHAKSTSLYLSDEERERLQQILDELREMFGAESVGFVSPLNTVGCRINYTIEIKGALCPAIQFDPVPISRL